MAIIPVFPKNTQQPLQPEIKKLVPLGTPAPKTPDLPVAASPASNPIFDSIDALQNELTSLHPNLPGLLSQILDQLKASPGVVTILTPEQIGVIIKGLQSQTNTAIIAVASKAKKPKGNLLDLI